MAEANSPDRSPDDTMDPDKEARLLLNPPNDSVQFTQSNTSTNGQVVLPINNSRSTSGVGMTKQELMKYANDPFWVRLRMILFILFWLVWLAMLVGAVVIVAFAPGCPATASLPWWQKASLLELKVSPAGSPTDKIASLEQLTKDFDQLKESLENLNEANYDTILITGIDPYLLASSADNNTLEHMQKLKEKLGSLIEKAHTETSNKIVLGLNLAETSTTHQWFNESKHNSSEYLNYYIWNDRTESNASVKWEYDVDRFKYFAKIHDQFALLNFANVDAREQVRSLLLSWVRTKVDGIQADGAFFVEDPASGLVVKSPEVAAVFLEAVKTGGKNKAFLISDDEVALQKTKEDKEASFDLAPDTSIWSELNAADNLKEALENVFTEYAPSNVQLPNDTAVAKDGAEAKENVGKNWRAYKVLYPTSEENQIGKKYGLSIAEAVLTAFNLIPKSTPLLQADGSIADQLDQLKRNNLLTKLSELRKRESESFLLGNAYLPQVSGDSNEVSAIYRVYENKNGFLLLINFATTSQTVKIDSKSLPNIDQVVSKRVVLADSHTPSDTIGSDINLNEVKLQPKQMLLVEFSVVEQ